MLKIRQIYSYARKISFYLNWDIPIDVKIFPLPELLTCNDINQFRIYNTCEKFESQHI